MTGHVVDRLSAYLDDELDGIERSRVQKHLGSCPECARHLEELLAVDEATRRLELVEPPEGYFESLPGRLRERVRVEVPAPKRFVVPAWTWAAAAAVLVAVVAPIVLVPSSTRSPSVTPPAAEPRVTAPAEEHPRAEPVQPMAAADRSGELAAVRDKAEGGPAGARDERLAAAPAPQQGFAPAASGVATRPSDVEPPRPAALGAGVAEGVPGGVVGGLVGGLPDASPPARKAGEPVPKAAGAENKGARAAAARQATAREFEKTGVEPAASEKPAFEELVARSAETAGDARALREAWRAFAAGYPDSPRADEARVRVIEAGLLAFRLGADPADRERAVADANAYLARPEAAQVERVRQALAALGR